MRVALSAVRLESNYRCPEMRVLIVEDEKRMAELLKKGLEEENHSASVAYDGPTGQEMAELYEFDAIVLDIMLPEIDGFEVARRLRRNRNQTPILILTARECSARCGKGLDVGAEGAFRTSRRGDLSQVSD